jgi:hypothetical protein
MARTETDNGLLGMWAQGDNPGAGAQDGSDSNALNGNWVKIDKLFIEHTTAGAHKSDVIDGPSLKTTVADGVTLELTGSPLKLQLKDGGITAAKLGTSCVTNTKISDNSVSTFKIQNDAVTTAKINTSAVTTERLNDDAVTAAKISHTNTRTKNVFTFSIAATDSFAHHNALQTTASTGAVMPRPGSITRVVVHSTAGDTADTGILTYGTYTFSLLDTLTIKGEGSDPTEILIYKSGADTGITHPECNGSAWFITVEVEFDD